jgi:CelD/BcsL family acetyltransferase involved in cellulose biosynthesis
MPSVSTLATFTFSRITSERELRALQPEWNQLLALSGVGTIYLTWEYLFTWWKVYGEDHQLCVLTARDESGRLCGIAPMAVGPGQCRRKLLRHLTFMGGICDSTSECQDFIIHSERKDDIVAAFCRMMWDKSMPTWDFLVLPAGFELSGTLRTARNQLGTRAKPEVQIREAPYADLPKTWEEYLKGRSPKFRSTIRNRLGKLETQHRWEFKTAGEDISLDSAFDTLLKLNAIRWGAQNRSFNTPEFIEFHRRLMPLLHEKGWLAMFVLYIDEIPAAVRYDFIYDEKIWGFQGGWDPAFAKLSIGSVMNALTFKWAIEKRGLREYDFGVEVSRYKTEWADCSRDILDFTLANPKSKSAWFFLKARALIKQPAQALSTLPSIGKLSPSGFPSLKRLL